MTEVFNQPSSQDYKRAYTSAIAARRGELVSLACSASLFACLFHVVVNVTYLAAAPIDDPTVNAQALLQYADGNTWGKIFTIAVFVFVFALVGWRKVITSISLPYAATVFWCFLSSAWAIDPGISIRRSVAMAMLLLTVSSCIKTIGAHKTLRIIYIFSAFILISSLICVLLSPISIFSFSRHPADEADPSLIGAWRGLMKHKNVAGAIMIYCSVLFMHFGINRGRLIDWLLFTLSIVFLIGTKSKTSFALLGIVISADFIYQFFMKRQGGARNIVALALFVFCSMLLVGYADLDRVHAFLSNPANLSGRIAIWTSLATYIRGHLLLGAGYGSFWTIGLNSPIYEIAVKPFVRGLGHSHNGYLEILVTVGLPGLVSAMIALVAMPLYRLLTLRSRDLKIGALCFSFWFFGILQNCMESQFFAPDKESWMYILISICLIHNLVGNYSSAVTAPRQRFYLRPANSAAKRDYGDGRPDVPIDPTTGSPVRL